MHKLINEFERILRKTIKSFSVEKILGWRMNCWRIFFSSVDKNNILELLLWKIKIKKISSKCVRNFLNRTIANNSTHVSTGTWRFFTLIARSENMKINKLLPVKTQIPRLPSPYDERQRHSLKPNNYQS